MPRCQRPRHELLLHAIIGGLFSEHRVPPGAVFDVGTSDGEKAAYYACLDSSRVVHALEPSLYHALRRSPAGNISKVAPLRTSLSSTDRTLYGTDVLGLTPQPGFSLYHIDSLFMSDKPAIFAGEMIGFWHLDVEWHAVEVLRGAIATIQRDQPIIVAEVRVHWNRTYTHELTSFIQTTLGYAIYLVDEICSVRIDCRNLLCVPASRAGSMADASHTLQLALGSGSARRATPDTIFQHTPTSVEQLFETRRCNSRNLSDVQVRRHRKAGQTDPMEVTEAQLEAERKTIVVSAAKGRHDQTDLQRGGEESIAWITPALWSPRNPLQSCAIVGSGAGLRGRGLGVRIDAHDLVVRINNLHGRQADHDLGNRTDVYFSKPCRVVSIGARHAPQIEVLTTGLPRYQCSIVASNTSRQCPFRAFVMRGGTICANKIEALMPVRSHAAVAIGREAPAAYDKARQVLGLGGNSTMDATTGFHAVVTFRPLCSSISLFGFDGDATYDGHHLINHAIDREHELLRQMALEGAESRGVEGLARVIAIT